MYRIKVQLFECDSNDLFKSEPLYESQSHAFKSIQEAFESLGDGKKMFDIYMNYDIYNTSFCIPDTVKIEE